MSSGGKRHTLRSGLNKAIEVGKPKAITSPENSPHMSAEIVGLAIGKRSTLKITSVDVGDSGLYECRATTVRGKVISVSAKVTVHPPPNNSEYKRYFSLQYFK
ncbi:hypothetical protein AAG570_009137 [Ranatra chinensis]|uniref:Ig-like domain-containing protein n=1 Tax=Ranatra chinensis TaxID=642074 RepID=A0ABD0YT13_9HEMI